jgi:probable addiction module antidote protein
MVALFLTEAFDTGDASVIAHALGIAARAKGMSALAREAGRSRESLYRTLSETGNPELSTVLDVLRALGFRLTAEPADETADPPSMRRA